MPEARDPRLPARYLVSPITCRTLPGVAVEGTVSAHLFQVHREGDTEYDVAGFIGDLDGHVVEGSRR